MKRLIPAAILFTLMACGGGGGSSTPTTPTTPTARAAVTIVGFSVTGSLSGSEYKYSIPLTLQNTGSVAATINSVLFRLTLPNEPTRAATLTGTEIFGTASLAAGASVSRSVVLSDTNDHAFASSLSAVVTYTDSVGANTTTQSADVPPLPTPPPTLTYALSGTIVDGSAGVSSARVEVTTGPDAGAALLTDGSGGFSFSALRPGTLTLLISKSGYSNLQQNVTLSGNTSGLRLNLTKSAAPPPPPPTNLCAPATGSCGTATARCNDGTLSCSQNRSGTCSSHSGVSCFICPGLLCSAAASTDAISWTPVSLTFTPAPQSVKRE